MKSQYSQIPIWPLISPKTSSRPSTSTCAPGFRGRLERLTLSSGGSCSWVPVRASLHTDTAGGAAAAAAAAAFAEDPDKPMTLLAMPGSPSSPSAVRPPSRLRLYSLNSFLPEPSSNSTHHFPFSSMKLNTLPTLPFRWPYVLPKPVTETLTPSKISVSSATGAPGSARGRNKNSGTISKPKPLSSPAGADAGSGLTAAAFRLASRNSFLPTPSPMSTTHRCFFSS
mmetsp:Transcript_117896/g.263566  ORF Transcript_117896/g.263566 Transcript_117896/m.263566 type:complete len:226 (-) Transcript_117896:265-942(-)